MRAVPIILHRRLINRTVFSFSVARGWLCNRRRCIFGDVSVSRLIHRRCLYITHQFLRVVLPWTRLFCVYSECSNCFVSAAASMTWVSDIRTRTVCLCVSSLIDFLCCRFSPCSAVYSIVKRAEINQIKRAHVSCLLVTWRNAVCIRVVLGLGRDFLSFWWVELGPLLQKHIKFERIMLMHLKYG